MISLQSPKIQHCLGLADIYLALGKPRIYTVEPEVTDEYIPDAYTIVDDVPTMIELQRSTISKKKMVHKVDMFVESYKRKKHNARNLIIYSDHVYHINVPNGFVIEHHPIPKIEAVT